MKKIEERKIKFMYIFAPVARQILYKLFHNVPCGLYDFYCTVYFAPFTPFSIFF